MTVKDFKQQIAPYSTSELHLFELAIYQELEKRGVVPMHQDDTAMLEQLKALDEGIDTGATKLNTLGQFKDKMAKLGKR